MKRMAVFLISMILTALMALPVFATDGAQMQQRLLQTEAEEVEAVTEVVERDIAEWGKYLGHIDDVDFDNMYHLYCLEEDIFASYKATGKISSNISKEYHWVVPNHQIGKEVELFRADSGEWVILQGTANFVYMKQKEPDIYMSYEFFCQSALDEHPDLDTESVKYVYAEAIDCNFLYFTDKGREYVIPYIVDANKNWAQSNKVYEASEFIGLAEKEFANDDVSPTSKEFREVYFRYFIGGTIVVAVIAIGSIIFIRTRKNMQ